ncbi:hypothetical protein, partial [Stenotrophomonas pavanii]|uniref:hypothetical protein n=1 Tax=Stenotrophomonas pavanii TaxID=487698 RepID=UPI0039C5D91F
MAPCLRRRQTVCDETGLAAMKPVVGKPEIDQVAGQRPALPNRVTPGLPPGGRGWWKLQLNRQTLDAELRFADSVLRP